jgi:Tol biopolymer transport system component
MGEPKAQDPRQIREQLQRVLASPMFLHSERLRRFLTHCVEAVLNGRIEDLKEYNIGVVAFDRPRHYNPADDPIVRVEARRLRKKLDEYYQAQGASDPVVIGIPKGGYLPVFEIRSPNAAQARPLLRAAGAVLVLCSVAAGFWLFGARSSRLPGLTLRRLTTDHGLTTGPSLSADGSRMAYASDRGGSGNLDIWTQQLNQQAAGRGQRQLTTDSADDWQPDVSPDGSAVVFRSERQPPGIYQVPASGGQIKLLAPDGRNPRYSPDGRWIAFWAGSPGGESLPPAGRVYVMPSGGGVPRLLLPNFTSAACPVWSPRGDSLLVEAIQTPAGHQDLWAVSPGGERVTASGIGGVIEQAGLRWALNECSFSWDANTIVFSALGGDTQNLWRTPASRAGRAMGPAERLTFGSAAETLPFASPPGFIAFTSSSKTTDVWRMPVNRPEELARVSTGVNGATFPQALGDGLVFLSQADGRTVISRKDLRTGQTTQLASTATEPRYPQLCPDGETVVYSEGPNTFAVTAKSASPRLVCNGCSRVWQCGDRGLLAVPAESRKPVEIDEFALPAGPRTPLVVSPAHDLAGAQLSSDGWLAFHAITGAAQRQIFVARYGHARSIPQQEWIPVTAGLQLDRNPVWNERSDTLYFLSERCGFRCIWSQRLDASTKKPVGEPAAVRHFHSARLGLSAIGDTGAIGLSFTGGFLYFALAEQAGDIWLARPGVAAR